MAVHRFGDFELDPSRFELRRHGRVVKLERIPMDLLILLVQKDGSITSRQEIIERLWGKDVFVDTEHGINTAIRKIRRALRDDRERPQFVRTVTGKGYCFVGRSNGSPAAAVDGAVVSPESATAVIPTPFVPSPNSSTISPPASRRLSLIRSASLRSRLGIAALLLCLAAGALLAFSKEHVARKILSLDDAPQIHSIAVLPLVNVSGDASQEYFADGMTDELTTDLAKNLRVISRTSAMRYKGTGRKLSEIARELGVDGILEGSVSRSEGHVHITVQLIYAPTDTHVWAESYDRSLNDVVSLPSEMSQAIAKELKVTAARSPQRFISPEAHDAYLQGRYYFLGSRFEQSKDHFQEAVELQPDYAAAWAGLANSYGAMAKSGQRPQQEVVAKVRASAERAVELDDSLGEAHHALSAYYLFDSWEFQRAEAESRRAIELDPKLAEAYHIRCYILFALNRDDEAVQAQKRASEIEPFPAQWTLGYAYVLSHRYDDAIRELKTQAAVQRTQSVQFRLSSAYRFKGDFKDAAEQLESGFLTAGDKGSADSVRYAFERGGDTAVQEWLLRQDLNKKAKKYVSSLNLAYDYARLARREETLSALEDAFRERAPGLVFLQKEPDFDFLHSDPRYEALVKKIGLPPLH